MNRPCPTGTLLVACVLTLAGCASSSGVFQSGKDTYTVVVSQRGSWASMGDLTKQAYAEANGFCEARGKAMQPIATHAHARALGSEGYFELTFRALDPNDPEYRRPTLETVPDTTIEVRTK
jgi:hypothetical protein